MPRERIEPACPVKTILKVSPTWAASMAVRPASPSRPRQGERDEDVVAKRHTGQTDPNSAPTKPK
jgi:hypothetical protein